MRLGGGQHLQFPENPKKGGQHGDNGISLNVDKDGEDGCGQIAKMVEDTRRCVGKKNLIGDWRNLRDEKEVRCRVQDLRVAPGIFCKPRHAALSASDGRSSF